jgi:TRAP-type C4-dicarboxylate transport system permease small subunit
VRSPLAVQVRIDYRSSVGDPVEIQPGDPNARRHALMVLVIMIGAGIIVRHQLGIVLDDIAAQAEVDPERAVRRIKALLGILAMLMSCSLLVLATVVAWIGRRTAATRRFPPPGLPVLGDTPVRTGAAALWIARGGYAGAVLFAFGALAVYWQLERLVAMLG